MNEEIHVIHLANPMDHLVDGALRRAANREVKVEPVTPRGNRPGRNDPCSCGSGKKWKKCCGVKRVT